MKRNMNKTIAPAAEADKTNGEDVIGDEDEWSDEDPDDNGSDLEDFIVEDDDDEEEDDVEEGGSADGSLTNPKSREDDSEWKNDDEFIADYRRIMDNLRRGRMAPPPENHRTEKTNKSAVQKK